MKKALLIAGGLLGSFIVAILIMAASNKIYPVSMGIHPELDLTDNVALNGHDVVAYFTHNKALKGKKEISYTWQNAQFYFSDDSTRALFVENPEKYMPQFGGYCTFAISQGFTAHCAADNFLIEDDKLYIFKNEEVKQGYLAEHDKNKKNAHANWDNE